MKNNTTAPADIVSALKELAERLLSTRNKIDDIHGTLGYLETLEKELLERICKLWWDGIPKDEMVLEINGQEVAHMWFERVKSLPPREEYKRINVRFLPVLRPAANQEAETC